MKDCVFIKSNEGTMYFVPLEKIQGGELVLHKANFYRTGAPKKSDTEFISAKAEIEKRRNRKVTRATALWAFSVGLVPELLLVVNGVTWLRSKL